MRRYCSTNALLTNVKPLHISNDAKFIIKDKINDKYITRFYKKLNTADKRLVKWFVQALKLDVDVNSKKDDDYKKQFKILVGEMQAGNSSPQIKTKLKQYITESIESGFIPKRQAFAVLFDLADS